MITVNEYHHQLPHPITQTKHWIRNLTLCCPLFPHHPSWMFLLTLPSKYLWNPLSLCSKALPMLAQANIILLRSQKSFLACFPLGPSVFLSSSPCCTLTFGAGEGLFLNTNSVYLFTFKTRPWVPLRMNLNKPGLLESATLACHQPTLLCSLPMGTIVHFGITYIF